MNKYKHFWFDEKVVVEAIDAETAKELFCNTYPYEQAPLVSQEVDLDMLKASSLRFTLIMPDGVGVTIND